MTQEQAAEAAEGAVNTWSRWEQPGFRPRDKQLEKILAGLGCAADDLAAAFTMAMARRYMERPAAEIEAEAERWTE